MYWKNSRILRTNVLVNFPPIVDIIFSEVEPFKRQRIGSLAETNAVAVYSRRWLISMLLLVGLFYIGNPMREEVIE